MPQATIGHFHILETLGTGGMGEVYRARDTRLNRLVALKVLHPAGSMTEQDRNRRFLQEAQAVSALQHPNIVAVHDIGKEDGTDYIVMEYVSGRTLDALIPRHGMEAAAAVRIAIEIADGLAAAHAVGIVHRDLKPSNVMIDDVGRVRILDFGVAKVIEPDRPLHSEDVTRTQRITTGYGTIVGTTNYMSPEQAEGREVDTRSDIFSFGAVLFEMLTGHRAFTGATAVATISAILLEEPVVPDAIPPELRRLLRTCLRKDRAKRFQHIADIRIALQELLEDFESGPLVARTAGRSRKPAHWIAAATIATALTAAGVVFVSLRSHKPLGGSLAVRQLTAGLGTTSMPAISPDGKLLAYAAEAGPDRDLDIWIQPLTPGGSPVRLTRDPASDFAPAFSPDGGHIAFVSDRDGLGIYVIPAIGGDERLVARGGFDPKYSPDGKLIAYGTGYLRSESHVYVVPAVGGTPRDAAKEFGWANDPLWSPDGRQLLVATMDGPNAIGTFNYALVPLAGGPAIRTGIIPALASRSRGENVPLGNLPLTSEVISLDWSGESLLLATETEAWTFRLDRQTGRVLDLRRLISGTAYLSEIHGRPARFVFSSATSAVRLWRLPVDSNSGRVNGPLTLIPSAAGSQAFPSSSRNGKTLVYLQTSPSGSEVRLRDVARSKEFVLLSEYVRPIVSPDGSWVAYTPLNPGAAKGLYVVAAAGGETRSIIPPSETPTVYGWSRDSNKVVFWDGTPIRFSTVEWRTGRRTVLISHAKYNIHGAELSPDEKWVAFHLVDSARPHVLIAPVRDGKAAGESEWITVATSGADRRPWWSEDGDLLYFISSRDAHECVWAQHLDHATKRPSGEAFAVVHFHGIGRSLILTGAPLGPAISRDEIIFGLQERTSNIWMAEEKGN